MLLQSARPNLCRKQSLVDLNKTHTKRRTGNSFICKYRRKYSCSDLGGRAWLSLSIVLTNCMTGNGQLVNQSFGRAGLPSFPSFFPKPKKGEKEESLDPSIAFLCKLIKGSSSKCVRQLNDWLTHRGSCVKRDLKGQNLLHDT